MDIIICKNEKEVAVRAYDEILPSLNNGRVGIASGNTPKELYALMRSKVFNGELNLAETDFFALDEYYPIPKESSISYHKYYERVFYDIPIKSLNILNEEALNISKECDDFDSKSRGLDVQILGIGKNGHIGFNEPGSSFDSKTRLINLSKSTVYVNSKESKVPTKALTMGLNTIMSAKKIVLLATGKSKSKIIKELLQGSLSESIPASILKKHEDVTIILDEEAASNLGKKLLILSPHPDDIEFAMGGTLELLKGKCIIQALCVTDGSKWPPQIKNISKIRKQEQINASLMLNYNVKFLDYEDSNTLEFIDEISNNIKNKIKELNPDFIFCNWYDDYHTDHKVVATIIKNLNLSNVVQWEEYSSLGFTPNIFVDISSVQEAKIKALSIYESQSDLVEQFDPFKLNSIWGFKVGSSYAEAFNGPEEFKKLLRD